MALFSLLADQHDGKTMSRYTTMTIGFLLVFMGIKFHMVESYLLTPNATKFWNERIGDQGNLAPNLGNNQVASGFNANNGTSPFSPNSYGQYTGQYNPRSGYANTGGFANTGGYGATNSSVFQSASYQNPVSYQQPASNQGSLLGSLFYGPQKQLTTPKWLGWPVLFLGAVFILQGAGMRRS